MNIKLTPKQERFISEYLVDLNATQAAIRAGYSKKHAETWGPRLSSMPHIRELIEEKKNRLAIHTEMTALKVLSHWVQIATADVNELMQVRRTCCRYCYGKDNNYQWTATQYAVARAKANHQGKCEPDHSGGDGFDYSKPPYINCPECFGDGKESVYIADTRTLTGSAKLLYAGIKRTRYGVELRLRDQDDALRNIAKYLGMFAEKFDDGATGRPPVTIVTKDANEAAIIYKKIMGEN